MVKLYTQFAFAVYIFTMGGGGAAAAIVRFTVAARTWRGRSYCDMTLIQALCYNIRIFSHTPTDADITHTHIQMWKALLTGKHTQFASV